jgi:succinylglutamate desuccinylase
MDVARTIGRVLLVGGTHGNELIGAYWVQQLMQQPAVVQRDSFETLLLLANPKAVAVNRRYIDQDLNRCFAPADLQNLELCSYEALRSRDIYHQYGAEGKTPVELVIDLHSTTANMGLTLIVDQHPFNLQLAAHVQRSHPTLKICVSGQASYRRTSLPALCALGCTVEVGPVPQGTLHAELFYQTTQLTQTILDYVDQWNRGKIAPPDLPLTVYRYGTAIDYPRDAEGHLHAMIHPKLQGQDYQPLHPGAPIFLTFEGGAIAYEGSAITYPIFINEAAYYEKGIAFYLTEKQQIQL